MIIVDFEEPLVESLRPAVDGVGESKEAMFVLRLDFSRDADDRTESDEPA